MYPNVHCSTIYCSQDMETAYTSTTDEWIKKEDVINTHTHTHTHIYTMEYYSAIKKNEIMTFAATWMDLENTILSEVSLKEKDKYHMITLIYGI